MNTKAVKLIAIAMNESPYLANWIFHHLKFGFDEIDIYINNTTDNSLIILEKISKKYPVNIIDGDAFFKKNKKGNVQEIIYDYAYKKSLKTSTDYILFLDIDEYWTPLDFYSDIKKCLEQFNQPDIVSFEWALKRNEEKPFSSPFDHKIHVNKNQIVKSIFKTNLNIKKIGIHNISSENAVNILGDGSLHPKPYTHSVDGFELNDKAIKPYFVLHRLWRSPLEYACIIARGRRHAKDKHIMDGDLELKKNRSGYLLPANRQYFIEFSPYLISKYKTEYSSFLEECGIFEELVTGQSFIVDRAGYTLGKLKNNSNNELLNKVLTNFDIDEARKQLDQWRLKKSVDLTK